LVERYATIKAGKAAKMTKRKREKLESIYYSACEAADILRVCMNTMYSLLNSGEVAGIKIGSTWRIMKDELQKFKAAR
jgi:excisionase family DNA binding protein